MRVIGGSLRGRRLEAPPGLDVRPTADRARTALFDILTHSSLAGRPLADAGFLDAFAGTGAVGIEAWSRGARPVTLMELDAKAAAAIRHNLDALGVAATLLRADALAPPRAAVPAGFVFLDPPYRSGAAGPALEALTTAGWLDADSFAIIEAAAGEPFVPPPGFALRDERRYGAARFLFLKLDRQGPVRG